MLVIPAIDLRGGRCVRLRQGDFDQETVYSDDPAAMAKHWVRLGAKRLHLVDLDGAREGRPANLDAVRAIVKAVNVPCELGGGLRRTEDLEAASAAGVKWLVIGTQALKAQAWFTEMCLKYPDRLLLGLDARDGRVATHGWLETADCSAIELAQRFSDCRLAGLVYTDISRDGMLQGPNFQAYAELTAAVHLPVIASGGVTTLEDIRKLRRLPLAGCIVGKALYEGTIDLAEVNKLAQAEK